MIIFTSLPAEAMSWSLAMLEHSVEIVLIYTHPFLTTNFMKPRELVQNVP